MLKRATIFASALAIAATIACGDSTAPGSDPASTAFGQSLGVNIAAMTKLSPDLYIQDLVTGTGSTVTSGDVINVTYSGWIASGTQFAGVQTLSFKLGAGEVIQGWDQGIVGMRVGGTRRLVIGSKLGYGQSGRGPIPPNTTLVFTVQVTADSTR